MDGIGQILFCQNENLSKVVDLSNEATLLVVMPDQLLMNHVLQFIFQLRSTDRHRVRDMQVNLPA